MASASPIQTNFTSGELSPRLRARVDLEQYGNGAAELTNAIVLPAGGATKRPGSTFVAQTKSTGTTLVRAFTPDIAAAYVLELGDSYVRFYRNRAQVMNGSAPLELTTPWAAADLPRLRFAESVDVLYVFHPSYKPVSITRTGTDTFALASLAYNDGPYQTPNTGDVGAIAGSVSSTGAGTGSGGGSLSGSGSGSGGTPTEPGGAEIGASGGDAGPASGGDAVGPG